MKFIANLAILLVSIAYLFVAKFFVDMMESTKIADLGYNYVDVYLLIFACIFFAFSTFGLMFVALQSDKA